MLNHKPQPMLHHSNDVQPLVISLFFTCYSIVLNWFEFVADIDKAIMMPFIHVVQLISSLVGIAGILYNVSPRFKAWLNKYL